MATDWIATFLEWPLWERIAVVAGSIAAVLGVLKIALELIPKPRPKNEAEARKILHQMLTGKYPKRRFSVIKRRLGGSIPDDRIRTILQEMGAAKYSHPVRGEMWGLAARNEV